MSETKNEIEINMLVTLKFMIESGYNAKDKTITNVKDFMTSNNIKFSDINRLLDIYVSNKVVNESEFIEIQNSLHKQIDTVLMNLCHHHWIEDVIDESIHSRDICYCNKCFIYTKK